MIFDPEPDYFQNLITYSLSTDTSLVKYLWRCDQQLLHEVGNTRTDRRTNRCRI